LSRRGFEFSSSLAFVGERYMHRGMRKSSLLIAVLVLAVVFGLCGHSRADSSTAQPSGNDSPFRSACTPDIKAVVESAVVSFKGTGEGEVAVVTDPLCWHCRLGHKLLNEYPELYGTVRLVFFPRKSFIGSDMAAWILEDYAASDNLKTMIDYSYYELKQPKTQDLIEARMIVLLQFTQKFPEMLNGTSLPQLAIRLQKTHEAHVLASAELGNAAKLPGTPVLITGDSLVIGYGPDIWIDKIKRMAACK